MKSLKRICSAVLSAALVLPTIPCPANAEGEQSTKSISNDYIEFSVNEDTGFFSIGTLEGHPQKASDNNMNLLYDGDSIETSFATVRIDGKDYIFGQDYGIFDITSKRAESVVDAVNNTITTKWEIMGIAVTQTAVISRTDNTSSTGNVHLSYNVENTSDTAHTIGVRVMFDNALGEIDAPVVKAQDEVSPLSKETEFFSNGRDPGTSIRYIDSYEQPSKEAVLSFDTEMGVLLPNKVIVGHWCHLVSTKWDYTPDTDFAFDSGFNSLGTADTASALYWDETEYSPGNIKKVGLSYGVGEFSESYGSSNFNASLELEGELEYDSVTGEYKDNTIYANVHIYNNVDGSTDIENANLRLNCDDGLIFVVESNGEEYDLETVYDADLGFISAGSVADYRIKLRASVPDELKALKVNMVVTGNSSKNTVSMVKYVTAPSADTVKSPVTIEKIFASKFHITGQRVMVVEGTFPSELLEDKTKWKAAWVNTDNPSLRYEIDEEYETVTSDTELQFMNSEEMAEGTYKLELSFFEEYKELICDSCTSDAIIQIVNDKSLIAQKYGLVCIQRAGSGIESKYSMKAFSSEEEYTNYKSTSKANGISDIPLVLRGSFTVTREQNSNAVIKYTATDQYTINNVITGKSGDKIEYNNVSVDGDTISSDGVEISGENGMRFSSGDSDSDFAFEKWEIELNNGVEQSLAKENIKFQIDSAGGALLEIVGGALQLEYGIFVHDDRFGDCINFSGIFTMAGYAKDKLDKKLLQTNTVDKENGIDPTKMEQTAALSGSSVYVSAEISNCYVNSDGFAGIDTSFTIGIAAASIFTGIKSSKLALTVNVDTINNKYGGSFTIPVNGGHINAEIEFAVIDSIKWLPFVIDDLGLTLVIPPTSPIPIVPGIIGLTQLGISWNDLADLVNAAATPDEAVEIINSSLAGISGSLGLLLLTAMNMTGTINIGVSYWTLSVTGSSPYLPGLSSTIAGSLKATYEYTNPETKVTVPRTFNVSLSYTLNAFGIAVLKGAFKYQRVAGYDINSIEKDATNYFAGSVYGSLNIPAQIPVIGGMQLLGAEGIVDSYGFAVTAIIFGIEIGCNYVWGEDFTWVTPFEVGEDTAAQSSDSTIELSNAVYVPVEINDSGELAAISDGASISADITAADTSGHIIAFEYSGNELNYKDLALMIDGEDYPLTEATKAAQYNDGNCVIIDGSTSESGNGRIIIGVKNLSSGKHSIKLTSSTNDVRFTSITARGFGRSAQVQDVTLNSDGTVTVKADASLENSEVILYYTDSDNAYDDVITEEVTDDDGNTTIETYKTVDGQKVNYSEFMQSVSEYAVCDQMITDDITEVTLTPTVNKNINSGNYYLMAEIISPTKSVSRAYSSSFKYTNDEEPSPVKSAVLSDVGNKYVEVKIENEDTCDYSGYYVSLYNETDGEYVIENDPYLIGDSIKLKAETGKTYHAEIRTVKTTDDGTAIFSAEPLQTNSVTMHTPEEINVELTMVGDSVIGDYTNILGNTKETMYVAGPQLEFKVNTDKPVIGCFVYDGVNMGTFTEKSQVFTANSEFDEGEHSLQFRAVDDNGDETLSNVINFTVENTAPNFMLEENYIKADAGKITVKGKVSGAKTIELNGTTCTPAKDGSFEITANADVSDGVKKYTLTAVSNAGLTSSCDVWAVNDDFKTPDKIELMSNGESTDSITINPGDTVNLSLMGYSNDEECAISTGTGNIRVVNGNNAVTIDSNGILKGLTTGTAYVKAEYLMGSTTTDGVTSDNKLEDMIEVNVMNKASTVTASHPDGAVVSKGTKVTLVGDGDIYYTTDGSEPTTDSQLYTEPIVINDDVTIKSICVKDGYTQSDVMTVSYTVKASGSHSASSYSGSSVKLSETAAPTTEPTSENTASIIASSAETTVNYGYPAVLKYSGDGKIYYTTDGSTPNKDSNLYTEPIRITSDTTVKAVVWYEGDIYSDVQTFNYTLNSCSIKLRGDTKKSELFTGYPDGTFLPDNTITRAETAAILRRASEMSGYYVDDNIFTDTDMWAKDYINELAAAEIVNGYEDGTFKPNNAVTRAEFVAMLMRIIGETGGSSNFTDVSGHWAESLIDKAAEYGYISGYPSGEFMPDKSITRAEAAVIMSNVFGFENNGENSSFSDVSPAHWAFGYIAD